MAGLAQDWEAYTYASEEVRSDKEVALTAIRKSCLAYSKVPKQIRAEADFQELFKEGMRKDPRSIGFLPEDVRGDKDAMLLAISLDPQLMKKATPALLEQRDFILAAVKIDW